MGLFSGISKAIGKVAKGVAKVAAPVASVASVIPGPWQAPALATSAVLGAFGGGGTTSSQSYNPGFQGVSPAYGQAYGNSQATSRFLMEEAERRRGAVSDVFSKFSPKYYDSIRENNLAPNLRRINDSQKDEDENLEAALSRRGMTRSSFAADKFGDLLENFNEQRLKAGINAEDAVQSRADTISRARSTANDFLGASDNFTESLFRTAGNTGVNYVQNPGGSLSNLAQAVSESNALARYKQAQDNKAFQSAYGSNTPERGEVALRQFRKQNPNMVGSWGAIY